MGDFFVEKTGPYELKLAGELDLAMAGDLDKIVEREIPDEGDLTIDLEDVTFLDSAVIGVFARAARNLEGRGRLVLLSPTRTARLALEMVRLDARDNIEIVGDSA